ncbi:MAG: hypothetical protein J7L66_00930, partial [Anaerolineaceae bacterium]|nr:hypothetical protein [Anaerolineaceae bacterium]
NTPTAITTIFPRPGQAFWTLSALWASWLWGKKAAAPLRSALSRRRYDWYWFAKAVNIALKRISTSVHKNTLAFGLLPQFTPSLAYGLFAGALSAGFKLSGSAFRKSDELLEAQWKRHSAFDVQNISEVDLHGKIEHFLNSHGEPVEYQRILMHSIIELVKNNGIAQNISDLKESDFTQLQNIVKQLLTTSGLLESFPSEMPGGSLWWLVNTIKAEKPIAERIECMIRELLLFHDEIDMHEVDQKICNAFTESHTPNLDLIETILKSYATPKENTPNIFKLNSNEKMVQRDIDLQEIVNLLKQIGENLGQKTSRKDAFYWKDPTANRITYIFYPIITAEIAQYVLNQESDNKEEYVIVFPGSRSALINYRIMHDPRLSAAIEGHWHFLKFRYLRRLAKKEDLNLQSWKNLLDSDPPLWNPPTQLQFI